jgi:hypothetical protein
VVSADRRDGKNYDLRPAFIFFDTTPSSPSLAGVREHLASLRPDQGARSAVTIARFSKI